MVAILAAAQPSSRDRSGKWVLEFGIKSRPSLSVSCQDSPKPSFRQLEAGDGNKDTHQWLALGYVIMFRVDRLERKIDLKHHAVHLARRRPIQALRRHSRLRDMLSISSVRLPQDSQMIPPQILLIGVYSCASHASYLLILYHVLCIWCTFLTLSFNFMNLAT